MYSYVFYASIQLYTHCILEMTVAMFVFKYHHFRCYILHNVLKFICTLLCSKYPTEKLDRVKTKSNKEDLKSHL